MASTVHLDYAAMGEILKVETRDEINALADQIAANVRGNLGSVTDAQVSVLHQTTDRAKALVTIGHPAGMAMQAKHGTLTKAAAAVGLEVKSK